MLEEKVELKDVTNEIRSQFRKIEGDPIERLKKLCAKDDQEIIFEEETIEEKSDAKADDQSVVKIFSDSSSSELKSNDHSGWMPVIQDDFAKQKIELLERKTDKINSFVYSAMNQQKEVIDELVDTVGNNRELISDLANLNKHHVDLCDQYDQLLNANKTRIDIVVRELERITKRERVYKVIVAASAVMSVAAVVLGLIF